MNRPELQSLAEDRVLDAEALLAAGRWSGAYYLAGYAVECGLKACVLVHVERTGIIFVERRFAEKCWTHDIESLVEAADLRIARGQDISVNAARGLNWAVVKDWSEIARYEVKSEDQARRLFEAATNATNGVLPWIRSRW